jgi:hypothetical protein
LPALLDRYIIAYKHDFKNRRDAVAAVPAAIQPEVVAASAFPVGGASIDREHAPQAGPLLSARARQQLKFL